MKKINNGRRYFCDWYERNCIILDILIFILVSGLYSLMMIVIEGKIDISNIVWILVPSGITWLTIHTILVICASESSENKRKIKKKG